MITGFPAKSGAPSKKVQPPRGRGWATACGSANVSKISINRQKGKSNIFWRTKTCTDFCYSLRYFRHGAKARFYGVRPAGTIQIQARVGIIYAQDNDKRAEAADPAHRPTWYHTQQLMSNGTLQVPADEQPKPFISNAPSYQWLRSGGWDEDLIVDAEPAVTTKCGRPMSSARASQTVGMLSLIHI